MRRILIVDDEPLIREILMTTLADEGYEVVEAESGEVALELFREKPCDLVISDISMSNISGIDLLFSLKQIYPDVEVILITGYASVETAQAALEGGAYRYLKKPFHDLEEIIQIVAQAIEVQSKKEQQKEKFQEAICQRDTLKQRLGQVETMYRISHATSFPEKVEKMLEKVGKLLQNVIPLDFLACVVRTKHVLRIYIALLHPIAQQDLDKLLPEWKEAHKNFVNASKIITIESEILSIDTMNVENKKIERIVEIHFPDYSDLNGSLYLGLPKERILTPDEEELLDVTTVLIAGSVNKLYEYHIREQERLKVLIEGMIDGVIFLQEDGKISMSNQSTLRLLHCDKKEEIVDKLKQLNIFENVQKLKGAEWSLGEKVETSDNRIFYLNMLPLSHPWETATAIVLKDMTQEFIFQQEVERSQRLASVTELVAGVVHEIKTPLTVIMGYSEMLGMEDLPENVKQDLNIICQEAQRCQKMVQNLLGLARFQASERTTVQISEILQKVLELKQYAFRKNNIKVQCQIPEQSIMVDVDPSQIQQVFLNLLNNAQDAMQGQEKELEIQVVPREKEVKISIKDSGTGIPKEILEEIFHPFFTTKETGQGNGLGLSICHRIIEEHNGKIFAVNNLTKGSTFTVILPLFDENYFTHNVLIFTYQQGLVQMLSNHLRRSRIRTKIVMNEEIALKTLQENTYHVVIIDSISEENKSKRLFEFCIQYYHSRTILLVKESLSPCLQTLVDDKVFQIIPKPFTLSKLDSVLRDIFQQKQNIINNF